jgi:hypothetical protein
MTHHARVDHLWRLDRDLSDAPLYRDRLRPTTNRKSFFSNLRNLHRHDKQDGKVVKPSEAQRARTVSRCRTGFRSLPNVICDDFFTKLARLANTDPIAAAPSDNIPPDRARPASGRRRVKVYCRLRELDPKTGRNLTRHQLTRVREEEIDDDEGQDSQGKRDEVLEFEFQPSQSTILDSSRCSSSTRINLDEGKNFASFLSGQRRSRPARPEGGRAKASEEESGDEFSCSELFVFHNSELLVHRNQLVLEAQALARRLDRLRRLTNKPRADSI